MDYTKEYLTPVEDITELQNKGEETRELEFGVRYPDGSVDWNTGYYLYSSENREKFLNDRKRELSKYNLKKGAGKVVFLQRKKIVTYTHPEVVD